MPPSLVTLLWVLGLYQSQRTSTQTQIIPAPVLVARPSSIVPNGRLAVLRCHGSPQTMEYRLHFEGRLFDSKPAAQGREDHVDFRILAVTSRNAGRYRCVYRIPEGWSEPSDALDLVVTGLYDTPRLVVRPGPRVTPGEYVTFYCQLDTATSRFFLLKEGRHSLPQHKYGTGLAVFPLGPVTTAHRGTYRCFGSYNDYTWSFPSPPVQLLVTDGTKNTSFTLTDPTSPDVWDPDLSVTESGFQKEEPGHLHLSTQNLLRVGMALLVLLFLLGLLAEDWLSRKQTPGGAGRNSHQKCWRRFWTSSEKRQS